jgi:uncharacterized membrane protein
VPDWVSARSTLALVSGAILIVGSLAAPWRSLGWGRLILPSFYALWVFVLHLPNFASAPNVGSLLGVAEILSLAAAGMALAPASQAAWLKPAARVTYGLCPLVFGLSHIVYADGAAAMVPAWLPDRLFWVYLTGAAHIAAGLAILSGILARLAIRLLALMCGSFVLLVHVPGVAAAPTDRLQWTMLAMAMSITGAAWLARRLLSLGKAGEPIAAATVPAGV